MRVVRTVILAAGLGTRLRPLTDDRPKGLVRVAGRPLLWHTLAQLHAVGVAEAVVVTGYRREQLEESLLAAEPRPRLEFLHNPRFATTNSIVSLALTRQWWSEPFCLVDSDVAMRTALVRRLVSHPATALVIDSTRPPSRMDMRARVVAGRLHYLDKELPESETTGEFFGLSRWLPAESEELSGAVDVLLRAGRTDEWYDVAIRQAAQARPIGIVPATAGEWAEIDEVRDIGAATGVIRSDPELTAATVRGKE